MPIVLIAFIGGLILLNALLWPPRLDDAVSIYAFWGKQIAVTGSLPAGPLYESYPQLIQMCFAFVFQLIAGDFVLVNGVIGLFPAALAVGAMGAAYCVGCEVGDGRTGLMAALLLALTPAYVQWASSSYADLPAGFFYALAVAFLLRWERHQRLPDALLAGVMAGLAAWTKNSALLIVPTLTLWGAYTLWRERRLPDPRGITLIVVGLVVVAAPWYLYTLTTAGVIVPPTVWTAQAQRTLTALTFYLTNGAYLPSGIAFAVGILFAGWRFVRMRDLGVAVLLIFFLPYAAAWWLFASYDPRFLLTVIPLVAVMGAAVAQTAWAWVVALGERSKRMARLVYGISLRVLVAVVLLAGFAALDFKRELVSDPALVLNGGARLRVVHGGRYEFALAVNAAIPAGARLWVQDYRLPYLFDEVTCTVGGWPTDATQLAGYGYWVLSPAEQLPTWFADTFGSTQPLVEVGGYRLFALN
jgi:4-amino-4-deoxy-L-arabinose transferase-like glycosyltransferase